MKTEQIETILSCLQYTIAKQRSLTLNDDNIRVRMGRELAAWINGYNRSLLAFNYEPTEYKTIFGYPLEIDNANPMCLEVELVEKIYIKGVNY